MRGERAQLLAQAVGQLEPALIVDPDVAALGPHRLEQRRQGQPLAVDLEPAGDVEPVLALGHLHAQRGHADAAHHPRRALDPLGAQARRRLGQRGDQGQRGVGVGQVVRERLVQVGVSLVERQRRQRASHQRLLGRQVALDEAALAVPDQGQAGPAVPGHQRRRVGRELQQRGQVEPAAGGEPDPHHHRRIAGPLLAA